MKKTSILQNAKHIVLISLLSLIPLTATPVDYQEYNSREMESKLHYGDSIKDDNKWQEYSQDVKDQLQARWERDAEAKIMAQLGLTEAETAEYLEQSEYTNALADWEVQADSTIDALYGVWRARQDWGLTPDIASLKNILKAEVWLESMVLTNLDQNVVDMKGRVQEAWVDYYHSKQSEVSNNMATLLGSALDMPMGGNARYVEAIESYASHHLNALATLGRTVIFQEQVKYLNYINRMDSYQNMVSGTNFIFDETFASNWMAYQASNVNNVASNMVTPVTLVKRTISAMQSNLNALSESLMIPETPEEDLEVAIEDWEEMVQGYYHDGLEQWDDALKSLTWKMNGWMSNATLGYEQGLAEWDEAYSELTNAKWLWLDTMQSNLNEGMYVWNDKLAEANIEYDQSLVRLSNEMTRVQADYGRYHQGMMNIFLEGGSTLQSIELNLGWLADQLTAAQTDNDYSKESNIQAMIAQWTAMKTRYEGILADSEASLRDELYSGTLGQGIYSNVTGEGVDIYLRSDLEMQYARRAEELKYAQQRMDIAQAVMDYANGEADFDQTELSNSIEGLSLDIEAINGQLSNAMTALRDAIAHTDLSNTALGAHNEDLFTQRTNMESLQIQYNIARTNFDYHQQLAAMLSAGQEMVQARATNYILQALQQYMSAQEYYDTSRKSYYELFIQGDLEQRALDLYQSLEYYEAMSLTNRNAHLAMGDAYSNTGTPEALADYVNTNTYYALTNNISILDWEGYVESILHLSNTRALMMENISLYLQTGESNSIQKYSDYDTATGGPTSWMLQNTYIQKTAAALTSFSNFIMTYTGPFTGYSQAFELWSADLDTLLVTDYKYFDKSVRYSVWTLTSGNTDFETELTNTFNPDPGSFFNEYTMQAMILQRFSDSDFSLSEEGIYGFLVEEFTAHTVNDEWDTDTYFEWVDLLLNGGGIYEDVTHYYTSYLLNQDLVYGMLMQEAWQRSGEAGRILAQKDLMLSDIELVSVNDTQELYDAIMDLTNHLTDNGTALGSALPSALGSALGQYINEMIQKIQVLNLETAIASNQMSVALDQYTNMAPDYYQRKWLYDNQTIALSLDYVESLLQYSNVTVWNTARDYMISQSINLTNSYNDQSALTVDLYTHLTNLKTMGYYSYDVTNTMNAIQDNIINSYLENKVYALITNINAEDTTSWGLAMLSNALSGWDDSYIDRASAYYRVLSWNYITAVNATNESLTISTNDWYTALSHSDLTSYLDQAGIYADFQNGEELTNSAYTAYNEILGALTDKRKYLNLLPSERAVIDSGSYTPLTYLLHTRYEDHSLETAYSEYISDLDQLMPDLHLSLDADADTVEQLQSSLSITNQLLRMNAQLNGTGEFRVNEHVTLLAELTGGSNTWYTLALTNTGWDSRSSNTLTLNTNYSDTLNDVYKMYRGLASLVSNYNEQYVVFTNTVEGIYSEGLVLSNATAFADGSLQTRQENMQQAQSQLQGPLGQMLIWADTWDKASQGDSYRDSEDYTNAQNAFLSLQTQIEERQDSYFSSLSNYDALMDGYYKSLQVQSQLKQTQEALTLTNRMLLARYDYAMTARIIGTETNSTATAAISNFIDPIRDYNLAQSNVNLVIDAMTQLALDIQAEKVLTETQQSNWNAYQAQYADKLQLQALMEIVRAGQYPAEKAMTEAQAEYYENSAKLLGGGWQANSLTEQLSREIGGGVVDFTDMKALLDSTQDKARYLNKTHAIQMSFFMNDSRYSSVYKYIYGVRSAEDVIEIGQYSDIRDYMKLLDRYKNLTGESLLNIGTNAAIETASFLEKFTINLNGMNALNADAQRYATYNTQLSTSISELTNKLINQQQWQDELAYLESIKLSSQVSGHWFTNSNDEARYHTVQSLLNNVYTQIGNLEYQISHLKTDIANLKQRVENGMPLKDEIIRLSELLRGRFQKEQAILSLNRKKAYGTIWRGKIWTLGIRVLDWFKTYTLTGDIYHNNALTRGNILGEYLEKFVEKSKYASLDRAINDIYTAYSSDPRGKVLLGLTKDRYRDSRVYGGKGQYSISDFNSASKKKLFLDLGMFVSKVNNEYRVSSIDVYNTQLRYNYDSQGGKLQTQFRMIKSSYNEYTDALATLSNYTIYLEDSWLSDGELTVFNKDLFDRVITAGSSIGSYNLTGLWDEVVSNKALILTKIKNRGLVQDINNSISLYALLGIIQESVNEEAAYSQYKLAEQYTNDTSAKVFNAHMLDLLYSDEVYSATPHSSGAFNSVINEIGNIKADSWRIAKQQEQSLQTNSWKLQLLDLGYQRADYKGDMWNLMYTGNAHWNTALTTLTNAKAEWQTAYMTAYTNGVNTWQDKLTTLGERRQAWQALSIEYVNQGSSYEIYEDLKRNLALEINDLLEADLPDDITRKVVNHAKQLKDEVMLKQSEGYQDYFTTMLGNANNADVSFVMDGISRFGGGSRAYREFQQEMQDYQDKELEFRKFKVQEEFKQEMNKRIDNFNEMLADSNEGWRDNFEDMFRDSDFNISGSAWIKKDVIVDATMWQTEYVDQALWGYQDLYLSLEGDYITPALDYLTGAPEQYETLLDYQTTRAEEDYQALYTTFTNHIGTQNTNRSIYDKVGRYLDEKTVEVNPDVLINHESYRQKKDREKLQRANHQTIGAYQFKAINPDDYSELDRLTWALSYFNMVEKAGWDKENRMWIDKGMWDSDRDNDGSSDVAIDVSLYDGLSAVAGIAVSVASFGTATPIVAAAIMGGIAMAHATAGLLTDHMNIDEWGAEMLKSGVTGVTSAFGGPVAQSLGGLVSSGIGVDPNGGLSFNLSDQALVSWGASTLLNTINIGGFTQDAIGGAGKSVFMNALAMGVGQGVNGFLSDSLGQGINMAYDPSLQFDWGSAGRSFGVGTVSGMATGFMNSAMGGTWQNGYSDKKGYHAGGYHFQDQGGADMHYSGKLNNASSVLGSFAGEWMDKALGGSFDMSFGKNLGFHWGTNGVSMDHNASGFSMGNAFKAFGDRRAIRTQMRLAGSEEGRSTMTYMNTLGYTKDKNAQKIANDILNGDKKVVYDLGPEEFGYADEDNTTIHLGRDDILCKPQSQDDLYGFYDSLVFNSSTMAREGKLLDGHRVLGNQQSQSRTRRRHNEGYQMEWEASGYQAGLINSIEQTVGVSMSASSETRFMQEQLTYSFATGDEGIFDWSSGRALKLKGLPAMWKNPTVNDIYHTIVEGEAIDIRTGEKHFETKSKAWKEIKKALKDGKPFAKRRAIAIARHFKRVLKREKAETLKDENQSQIPTTRKKVADGRIDLKLKDRPPFDRKEWRNWETQYDLRMQYIIEQKGPFCNKYTGAAAAREKIYLPISVNANRQIDYISASMKWALIPRLENGELNHKMAQELSELGVFTVATWRHPNINESGHIAVVEKGGYAEGKYVEMRYYGKKSSNPSIPFVTSYSGYEPGNYDSKYGKDISYGVRTEPLSQNFGWNLINTERFNYYYRKQEYKKWEFRKIKKYNEIVGVK